MLLANFWNIRFLEYKNGGKTNISVNEKEKLKVWLELPKYTLSSKNIDRRRLYEILELEMKRNIRSLGY